MLSHKYELTKSVPIIGKATEIHSFKHSLLPLIDSNFKNLMYFRNL